MVGGSGAKEREKKFGDGDNMDVAGAEVEAGNNIEPESVEFDKKVKQRDIF